MIATEVKLLDPRVRDYLTPSTPDSAGLDLRACWISYTNDSKNKILLRDGDSYTVGAGDQVLIGTGLAMSLASTALDGDIMSVDGFMFAGLLLPRSGLGTKFRITLANTVGLLDADYHGEILLSLVNGGERNFEVKALDRLAQLVVVPVIRTAFVPIDEFTSTSERGEGGFGSTGRN